MKKRLKLIIYYLVITFLFPAYVYADFLHEHYSDMLMDPMLGSYSFGRESSGTSWQPDSSPVEAVHFMSKDWMFMTKGFVNGIYDHQSGKRGKEKGFSESMFMFMGQRKLGLGKFGFDTMFSLDPLMGKKGYPLLLQTGETANGIDPLVDYQHPHDFFMELAASYSIQFRQDASVFAYFGLPGEPALGPPTFMHRFSAEDNPEAPITHHWLDSTHITYGVGTAGLILKGWKLEGSVFNGREPNENRWDIESPKFNSYSLRLSYNFANDWSMQISHGWLHSPEQLHPKQNTKRLIASLIYNKVLPIGNWQTTFAWGRNDNRPGRVLDGFLLESTVNMFDKHTVFSRLERVNKDELFDHNDPLGNRAYYVNKANIGYIYDFLVKEHFKCGLGSSVSVSILPNKIKSAYSDDPVSYMVFVRIKLI